jgi:hypothetical protein
MQVLQVHITLKGGRDAVYNDFKEKQGATQ